MALPNPRDITIAMRYMNEATEAVAYAEAKSASGVVSYIGGIGDTADQLRHIKKLARRARKEYYTLIKALNEG